MKSVTDKPQFMSKIEKVTNDKIKFYNGVTLPVAKLTLIDKAVAMLQSSFVLVTVENGKIITLEEA